MKWIAGLLAALTMLAVGAYVVVDMNRPEGTDSPRSQPSPEGSPTLTPTPSTTGGVAFLECSATPLAGSHDHEMAAGLPPAVADTRMAVIEAAVDCDYRRLEELAIGGRPAFGYSFGLDGSPATFWRAREREAREMRAAESEYLRFLVQTLQLPYCDEEGPDGERYFVWPRVHCRSRSASDWEDIRGLYPDEMIDQMRTGDTFYGFRVGILEDGDWVYFIAGD